MGERETVNFSIRIDKRIVAQLDFLAQKDFRKRNKLIEMVLAENCGLIDLVFGQGEHEKRQQQKGKT